jgi:hypothetical protein
MLVGFLRATSAHLWMPLTFPLTPLDGSPLVGP